MKPNKHSHTKDKILTGVCEEVASYLYEENIRFIIGIEEKNKCFCIDLIMIEWEPFVKSKK